MIEYRPRIYIADYGVSTYRALLNRAKFVSSGSDLAMRRSLIVHMENPVGDDEYLMPEGDAQSGTDTMLFEDGAQVLLSENSRIRTFGPDAFLYLARNVHLLDGDEQVSGVDAIVLDGDANADSDLLGID